MSVYDRLAEIAHRVGVSPEETSYFSADEPALDPKLFTANEVLRNDIRSGILSVLLGFWGARYRDPEVWSRAYLAGSGVSYQWSAARQPRDLDCLIGIDFPSFRRLNSDFRDLGDDDIASLMNQELHDYLWPRTANWHGYELTFYVNPNSYDIRNIHPYAAYSLTDNDWVVHPDPNAHPEVRPEWEAAAAGDEESARRIVDRYNAAYDEVEGTVNPGLRLNAEITLRTAAAQGADLFHSIHNGRTLAFAPGGAGYNSFHEYRYKAAKASGILPALRHLTEELQEAGLANDLGTYGVELPDAHRTLVAAALSRRPKWR